MLTKHYFMRDQQNRFNQNQVQNSVTKTLTQLSGCASSCKLFILKVTLLLLQVSDLHSPGAALCKARLALPEPRMLAQLCRTADPSAPVRIPGCSSCSAQPSQSTAARGAHGQSCRAILPRLTHPGLQHITLAHTDCTACTACAASVLPLVWRAAFSLQEEEGVKNPEYRIYYE